MGSESEDLDALLDRLDEAVLAFDPATEAHVAQLAARGRRLGRNARAVGFIGDSMTADPRFLGSFSRATADTFSLAPEVADRLGLPAQDGGPTTIVDLYRGRDVELGRDSFRARRAARIGAPASWALPPGRHPSASPVGALIRSVSPAVAVVMFGSNDATARFVPLAELARSFEDQMARIVALLEDRGIVPVLSTLPRHLGAIGAPACDAQPGDLSTWRQLVQTNRLSAAAAELACRRHLPLVDLRHALDAIPHHGIDEDGIHPNGHGDGAGKLDADGLRCGFNVRNYVTLRMLRQLQLLLEST